MQIWYKFYLHEVHEWTSKCKILLWLITQEPFGLLKCIKCHFWSFSDNFLYDACIIIFLKSVHDVRLGAKHVQVWFGVHSIQKWQWKIEFWIFFDQVLKIDLSSAVITHMEGFETRGYSNLLKYWNPYPYLMIFLCWKKKKQMLILLSCFVFALFCFVLFCFVFFFNFHKVGCTSTSKTIVLFILFLFFVFVFCNFHEMWPTSKDFFDRMGPMLKDFLWKTNPFPQHIPIYLNMWVPPPPIQNNTRHTLEQFHPQLDCT